MHIYRRIGPFVVLGALTMTGAIAQSPPAATPPALVEGQFYYLKGSQSGKNLSALPDETLALSPNTAGWEEWRYTTKTGAGGCPIFESFHGKELRNLPERIARHTPSYLSVIPTRPQGGCVTMADGGRVMIVDPQAGNAIRDMNGQVRSEHFTTPTHTDFFWTPIPVKAAAAGRLPRQWAVHEMFQLRSFHKTYLTATENGTVVHRPVSRESILFKGVLVPSIAPITVLRYGTPFFLLHGGSRPGNIMAVAPLSSPTPPQRLVMPRVTDSQPRAGLEWVIVDPTGVRKNGDLVPFGVQVALRQVASKRFLSVPPEAAAQPYLTPNAQPAQWELWTLEIPEGVYRVP
ncbi:hypothetical protein [Usitatibacter palustris]|uniref:Uncharacterized protein n=1 Tax=Usitatibacter palustris TaxID=2732487 RepID=A0A6M4HAR5_9PROT|nr:hypothetical protein [Usitatibacter palustris]QJR15938.1 hypothetical protein DSM104440_02765 [Usitatibacter palustris]